MKNFIFGYLSAVFFALIFFGTQALAQNNGGRTVAVRPQQSKLPMVKEYRGTGIYCATVKFTGAPDESWFIVTNPRLMTMDILNG